MSAITESMNKSAQRDYHLAQMGIPVNRDVGKYGHLDMLVQIAPKSSYNTNALTTPAQIDFEFKNSPAYFLKDNRSIILSIKATETGGSASVKPSFCEAFFDKNNSFEWLCNGQQITTPSPMIQTLLEPAIELSDTEYASIANTLNHNSALSYTSPTSISAGGSGYYFVRVPNPFPRDGLYLGALGSEIWTLRIHTQTTGAVDSGTGTLGLADIQLLLECVLVPEAEMNEMKREFSSKTWVTSQCQLSEPNQITLTATGESPRIQLQQLKDLPVTAVYTFIHASRSITASAYFNWISLQPNSKVHVIDRNGGQLWTSNSEMYAFNRYYRGARQLADSKLFQNVPLILTNPSPNIQGSIHGGHHHNEGSRFIFTGDEYMVITDSGSTASVYVDSAAFYDVHFVLRNGVLTKAGYAS
jgi:hypothetical protein